MTVLQIISTILFLGFLFGILALDWLNLQENRKAADAANKAADAAHITAESNRVLVEILKSRTT